MKYPACKDCKHFSSGPKKSACVHPDISTFYFNAYSGEILPHGAPAEIARENTCGIQGRFFEKRAAVFTRIFGGQNKC